jgi:hypothetical protein
VSLLQVFSFFEYSSQCSKRKLRLPMEPLVGMLRHPFVIPVCRPEVPPHALRIVQQWSGPRLQQWIRPHPARPLPFHTVNVVVHDHVRVFTVAKSCKMRSGCGSRAEARPADRHGA